MLELSPGAVRQTTEALRDPGAPPQAGQRAEAATSLKATIVIPAYNEAEALPHVLRAVFAVLDARYEVIVVDDGSSDTTAEVAADFPCVLISHPVNRGKGAAMQTGIGAARGPKVIFIDGDATYPASAIPQIVERLDQYDLVRCVRSAGRDNIPLLNRLGNSFFDGLISLVHQVEGADVLSGMYGSRTHYLRAMRLESSGFDIETEIMVKARSMGLVSHTMPISYAERIGEKKLLPMRDGVRIMARVLKLATVLNPFLTYIVPGLLLWVIGLSALLLTRKSEIVTPLFNLSVHTLIVSVMSFLAGFQLFTLGSVVNLYAAQSGLRKPSKLLGLLASRRLRQGSFYTGLALVGVGSLWNTALVAAWAFAGMGAFSQTSSLVSALALIVWGVQLISIALFLSLFARSAVDVRDPLTDPEPPTREREVGGAY